MKKLTTSLFVSFLILSSSLYVSAEAIDGIEPPKQKNLFTLKTEKEFVGAQVQIYNASGEMITSQNLQKRKMVIDFGDAGLGLYTIKVIKGGSEKEFKYLKK